MLKVLTSSRKDGGTAGGVYEWDSNPACTKHNSGQVCTLAQTRSVSSRITNADKQLSVTPSWIRDWAGLMDCTYILRPST